VRVVQQIEFVSEDPAFHGTTTMTWAVTAVDARSRVDIRAEAVPDGINAADHPAGVSSSLDNLAAYVER
jgi:4-aminobutyrate aminotransferase-like enzyme